MTSIIITIIFLSLFIFAAFFLVQFYNILFRGFAPFVSTHPSIISRITLDAEELQGKKIYELGCGSAKFLSALEQKFPEATLVGIEYSFLPWLIARCRLAAAGSKIKLVKKNIFKINLADADLIYCYLSIKTMKELALKFKQECKPGTQIISYIFSLPDLLPTKTIELEDNTRVHYYVI